MVRSKQMTRRDTTRRNTKKRVEESLILTEEEIQLPEPKHEKPKSKKPPVVESDSEVEQSKTPAKPKAKAPAKSKSKSKSKTPAKSKSKTPAKTSAKPESDSEVEPKTSAKASAKSNSKKSKSKSKTSPKEYKPGTVGALRQELLAQGVVLGSVYKRKDELLALLGREKDIKKKKTRDPNRPKRPLSAYMLYSKEMRPTIKEDHPEFKVTEVAKEIGHLWKKITNEEKAPFVKEANKLREAYQIKYDSYKEEQNEQKGPKRACSAYIHFSQAARPALKAKYPKEGVADIAKRTGEQWRSLSDKKKKPYQDMADADKARYEEAKAEWLERHPELEKASKTAKSAKPKTPKSKTPKPSEPESKSKTAKAPKTAKASKSKSKAPKSSKSKSKTPKAASSESDSEINLE